MDIDQLTSDLKSLKIDNHVEFIDDTMKKMKSELQIDFQLIDSIINAWSIISEVPADEKVTPLLRKCILFLRVACSLGSRNQLKIFQNDKTLDNIRSSIGHTDEKVSRSTWQLCSNLLVECPDNVEKAVQELLPLCLSSLETTTRDMDMIAAMIHNLLESNKLLMPTIELCKVDIYRAALHTIYRHPKEEFTFLQFLMEDLLIKEKSPKEDYFALTEDRIQLHEYVTEYVKSDQEEDQLSSAFLRVLSENFNQLSDNILTWFNGQGKTADPRELLSLLECLCTITGNSKYSLAYKSEASMFINSGALLVACCESQKVEVAPKAKLADFAGSEENELKTEDDQFYDFKTLLIRLIGNLAHKNKKNQDYARDLKILLTVCGCTTLDARNPLMKEWSILAIRNLLEDNLENQKLIHQLTQQGRVNSDVLKEYKPENGFLRLDK